MNTDWFILYCMIWQCVNGYLLYMMMWHDFIGWNRMYIWVFIWVSKWRKPAFMSMWSLRGLQVPLPCHLLIKHFCSFTLGVFFCTKVDLHFIISKDLQQKVHMYMCYENIYASCLLSFAFDVYDSNVALTTWSLMLRMKLLVMISEMIFFIIKMK